MSIKPDLFTNPLIASKGYSKSPKMSYVIDQILKRTTILVPRCTKAFLDIITDFPNIGHVVVDKTTKPFPRRLKPWCIIQFSCQGKNLLECDAHEHLSVHVPRKHFLTLLRSLSPACIAHIPSCLKCPIAVVWIGVCV